ncbi:putative leucine-rich repeat extensin-like protein 3 [Iris pallida]|uniref:Leucine-rich repeat extensin-like protein 3 n=1 Tax=Iris pallida TaxID=29817 RepID=A0AAX6EVC9_IRIPA|nr:putative leucine-rich repeat extensin-like protein 3 [Iris pallida]
MASAPGGEAAADPFGFIDRECGPSPRLSKNASFASPPSSTTTHLSLPSLHCPLLTPPSPSALSPMTNNLLLHLLLKKPTTIIRRVVVVETTNSSYHIDQDQEEEEKADECPAQDQQQRRR